MKVMDAPFEVTPAAWQVEANKTAEPQLSETEKHRWIWAFERLKNANIGLSFSDKAKLFCEASSPEEVEDFIEAKLHEPLIIPLAA